MYNLTVIHFILQVNLMKYLHVDMKYASCMYMYITVHSTIYIIIISISVLLEFNSLLPGVFEYKFR